MSIDWAELWELLILFILIFAGNRWSGALGGLFHALLSRPIIHPKLGKYFRFFLQSPLYLHAITKPIAWLISSSGILMGLGIHNIFWGTPNRKEELWLLLIFAFLAILEIVNELITFDTRYFEIDTIYQGFKEMNLLGMGNIFDEFSYYFDEKEFIRLARSLFTDQAIPQFFRLLGSIGVVYFCLGQLNLLPLVNDSPPNLWQSLLLSFSLIDVTGTLDSPYTGEVWNIIRLISSFLAFFWLVIFVSLASASIDGATKKLEAEKKQDFETRVKVAMEKILESTSAPLPMVYSYELRNPIRISKALINPMSVDAGNEIIELINLANTNIRIQGWKIEDKNGAQYELPELVIASKTNSTIKLPPHSIQLSNTSGSLRLLDNSGFEVDSVTYQKSQINEDGRVIWIEA
ncbi:MAG: hypothetical protein Fur0022_21760 [Anaerolineales bacterium]